MGWAGFAQKDILCLLKKSWIYRNEESYYIHPIVKRSIQLQMEKNGIKIDNSIYNNQEELLKYLEKIDKISLEELQGNYDKIISKYGSDKITDEFIRYLNDK